MKKSRKTGGLWHVITIMLILLITGPGDHAASAENIKPFVDRSDQQQLLQSRRFKIHGEYSLWVERTPTSTSVHWLTRKKNPGFLEVRVSDSTWYQFQTPDSLAHSISFPVPGDTTLRLNYGAATDPQDNNYTTIFAPLPTRPDVITLGVDSLYILGDVHGQYNQLLDILSAHKLIDAQGAWTGGESHLVLLGDVFDRGHDVIKTLWFLFRLEREALRAGGALHLVLGNHEIMAFVNDLRYTSGKELLIARYHGSSYSGMFDIYKSVLGKWLAMRPGIIRINEGLLSHGGVTTMPLDYNLQAFNDTLFAFLNEQPFQNLLDKENPGYKPGSAKYVRRLNFFFGPESPFWFRGYVQSDKPIFDLTLALKSYYANYQIVAHTPVATIRKLHGGKVLAVDLQAPATEMLLAVRDRQRKTRFSRLLLDGREIRL